MGLDINSTPISTTVTSQKVMACLSDFLSSDLSTTLQNEFNDLSKILGLAESIAEISCGANDDVRLNVCPRLSKTNKNMQSEAFSRKIIDQFTILMGKISKQLGLASYEIDELRIATAEAPAEILRDGFRTILTGFTDYGLFFRGKPNLRQLDASRLLILYAADWVRTALKEFCDRRKSQGIRVFFRNIMLNDVQIFFIEAKSKDYSRCLIACLPQMGAECIAL